MPEITGTIKAKSQYGVKMTDDGDWWNWSKPEYRGQPFDTSVVAGDTVHVEYAEADSGKVYISTIGKITAKAAEFDADGEFVDEPQCDDGEAPPRLPQEAPQELSGRGWGFEQKDKSILAQTCLKAAALQWVESLRAAVELYKLAEKKPDASELNAYAAAIMERKLPPIAEVLAKWCLESLD